jgi:hypothetical protein
MPFEVFDKRAATASKNPMVTIQSGGNFSLNRAAHELMDAPEAVELLYDPQNKLIGFRPVPPTNPRAFPVRPMGKNSATLMISGQTFTRHYALDTSKARRYPAELADGKILTLDLRGDSIEVSSPRSKKTDESA